MALTKDQRYMACFMALIASISAASGKSIDEATQDALSACAESERLYEQSLEKDKQLEALPTGTYIN